jgi:uncharacterized glyoxalase superfamily protein PhnB
MAVKAKPDGYHTVTPYLIVTGATQLVEFLKQAFGATERGLMGPPGGPIMHGEVQIGDSVIMLSDGGGTAESQPTRSMIHLYVDDVDAMYKSSLAAGAKSLREPEDQFYGDRSAGVVDAFGNQWWLATHVEDVSEEEMQKRMAAQGAPA